VSAVSLFAQLPAATVAGFIAATVIPYLSALVTRHPGWWTGAITLLLSALNGVFTQWAAHGDGFDWKAAVGAALISWVIAVVSHSKVLKGTAVEARLHAAGIKPATTSKGA
jgi:hypothetical protein